MRMLENESRRSFLGATTVEKSQAPAKTLSEEAQQVAAIAIS